MTTNDQSAIIEALKTLGLKSKEAAVLSFLMRNYDRPVTQVDIEDALHLRQPYVSSALRTIESYDWVDVSLKIKRDNTMGRPMNQYQLVARPEEIAQDLHDHYIDHSQVLKRSMRVVSSAHGWSECFIVDPRSSFFFQHYTFI